MIVFFIMLASLANGGLSLVTPADESYNCTFDTGFCSWRQASDDDLDWSRDTFTPQQKLGSPSGGHFVYIEKNPGTENRKARLVSGIIQPTDKARLDFLFYLFGTSTTTLNVYLQHACGRERQTSIFNKANDRVGDWSVTYQSFNSSTPFTIVIEGVLGPSDKGIIAIADLFFKSVHPVTPTQMVKHTQLTKATSVIETTSPRTTTAPKSSETVDMSMIIVDDTPKKSQQSEDRLAIVFDALKNVFGHLPGFLRIDIYTVKSGTITVHFGVTIDLGVSTAAISLSLAIEKLARTGQITFGNTQHRITDFQMKSRNEKNIKMILKTISHNNSGVSLSATSDVCFVHQTIFPCDSGHACDIIDDLPVCVQQKQCDRHLIVALSISIPIVIIYAFAVLVIICTRKRKEQTSTKSRRSVDDGQLSIIGGSTRYSSWHKRSYNKPTYSYDAASSSRSEIEKDKRLNNQRNAIDMISTYERNTFSKSSKNGNKDEVKIT